MPEDGGGPIDNEQVLGSWLSEDLPSSGASSVMGREVDFERSGFHSVPVHDWVEAEAAGLFSGLLASFSEQWWVANPVKSGEASRFQYGTNLHMDAPAQLDDGVRRTGRMGSGSPVRFAVNAVRYATSDTDTYGTSSAITADLVSLGVEVVRQTVDFDLWVPFRDNPVAVDVDGQLEAQVRSVREDLTGLLEMARDNEFKVVLTFLTLGGPNTYTAGNIGEDEDSALAAAIAEAGAPEFTPSYPWSVPVESGFLDLAWSLPRRDGWLLVSNSATPRTARSSAW